MRDPFIVSRRRLLQSAGGVFASSVFTAECATAAFLAEFGAGVADAAEVSDVMTTLSTYMGEAASRPLPAPVVEKTKHMILDTIAAMVSGS